MNKIAIPSMRQVMTPSPSSIASDSTLSQAKALMERLQVNHLPVLEKGVVESVMSDRDIKRFTLPAHVISQDEELLVSDISPPGAFLADIDDPLDRVLDCMLEHHLGVVIVLDQGELAGIFTETDACRILAELLRANG